MLDKNRHLKSVEKLDQQNSTKNRKPETYYLYYNSPYVHCLSLSVALIFGLYRPSSGPIALRNVLKCSTWHTFFTIRFWHFSSAAFIEKNAERVPMLVRDNKWCRIVYALQTTRDVHRGNNSDDVPLPLAEMSPGHSSILVASQSHRHRTYCYGECHLRYSIDSWTHFLIKI